MVGSKRMRYVGETQKRVGSSEGHKMRTIRAATVDALG